MSKSVRLARPRVAAGVVDQIVSSGTNFATSLVAARLLAPDRFGSVVVALSIAVVVVSAQRAFVGDTLLAYAPAAEPGRRAELARHAVTAAAVLGCAGALVGLAIGSLPFDLTRDVGWMAIWLPAVVVQDSLRYVAFAEGRPQRALLSDLVWAMVQGLALVVVIMQGWDSGPTVLATWGLGATAGATAACLLAQLNPLAGRPREWLRETRHLSGWFAAQTLVAQSQGQVVVFIIGGILGTAAVGGLRAVQLALILPVLTLLLAAQSLFVPRIAAASARGDYGLIRRWVRRLATQFLIGSVVLSVPVVIWRDDVVGMIFGSDFSEYTDLMLPVAVATVLLSLNTPYTAACRGLQNARGIFGIQALYSFFTIPAAIVGAITYGVLGAAWAMTLGNSVLMLATTATYRRTLDQARRRRPGARAT